MSNKYELYKEAVQRAKTQVKLLDWCAKLGIELRGNYAKTCPFCQKKGKFHIRDKAMCYYTSCEAHSPQDHISLMMKLKGCDYRSAGDALLEFANIRNPYHS